MDNQFDLSNSCPLNRYCDGQIDCPWLTPNDEENCTGSPSGCKRCACNQPGNFTCEIEPSVGGRRTCFYPSCKCK